MITLTYVSEATNKLLSGDIFKIIETSAKNNSRDGLTGFLIFSDNRFFQVLEGPETEVTALMAKLGEDDRHSNIRILHRNRISKRSFPRWGMKRLAQGQESAASATTLDALSGAAHPVQQAVMEFLSGQEKAA
ncbi:MAG: BLUF domain-containing protein [Erythrobacter sp.]